MIDINSLSQYVLKQGIFCPISTIQELISKIDREQIKECQKNRFKYEIWDKRKSINGVTAEEIIKNRNYDIEEAFLVYIDNSLLYFQDYKPFEKGYIKMNKKEVNKIAQEFVNKKIEDVVDNIIIKKIINELCTSKEGNL